VASLSNTCRKFEWKVEVHVIPCSDPKRQYHAQKEQIDAAIASVLERGRYVNGEEASFFENEFATFVGARFGIGTASGTDALQLALAACGVGAGDEVVTVSHTAVATVAAIEMCSALPVLVDIIPDTYCMDPGQIRGAISSRTRAIVPVHLYGQPAEMDDITAIAREHGVRVVEDCAQATGAFYRGARVGSIGDVAAFSFYPTKNLGAVGDGGMIVTSDPGIADRARMLREYGWKERYVSEIPGRNSRLDELQAAILRVKLRALEADNAARRRIAARYLAGLDGLPVALPRESPDTQHAFHLFVVRHRQRDHLRKFLLECGVGTLIHYPVPIHLQPAYAGRLRVNSKLPHSESASAQVLSLPMFPQLLDSDAQSVIDALRSFPEA
jgi:dTDP-4-amino-4,6-dideoxygalactose transaminase